MQCEYIKFEQAIAAATNNNKNISPLELIAVIKLLYADSPPIKCLVCQAMTRVNTQTGQFVMKGRRACQYYQSH